MLNLVKLLRTCNELNIALKFGIVLCLCNFTNEYYLWHKMSFCMRTSLPCSFFDFSKFQFKGDVIRGHFENIMRKHVTISFFQEFFCLLGIYISVQIVKEKKNTKEWIEIILQSGGMDKKFQISRQTYEKLLSSNIKAGDFVIVNLITGEIKLCEEFQNENIDFKLPNLRYANQHKRFVVQKNTVSLLDLDLISRSNESLTSIFTGKFQNVGEIKKSKVDKVIRSWIKKRRVKLRKGIVFIPKFNSLSFENQKDIESKVGGEFYPNIISSVEPEIICRFYNQSNSNQPKIICPRSFIYLLNNQIGSKFWKETEIYEQFNPILLGENLEFLIKKITSEFLPEYSNSILSILKTFHVFKKKKIKTEIVKFCFFMFLDLDRYNLIHDPLLKLSNYNL